MKNDPSVPLGREDFERRLAAKNAVERREGLWLVVVSVGLGVAQLVFLRWADANLERSPKLAIAAPAFFAYLAIVGGMLLRMVRRVRAARPECPLCGARLEELSVRVALATGHCDRCGGEVVRMPGPPAAENAGTT
jgi:hypothetical protein